MSQKKTGKPLSLHCTLALSSCAAMTVSTNGAWFVIFPGAHWLCLAGGVGWGGVGWGGVGICRICHRVYHRIYLGIIRYKGTSLEDIFGYTLGYILGGILWYILGYILYILGYILRYIL